MTRFSSWLDPKASASTAAGIATAAVAVAAITLLIFPLKRLIAAPSLDALYVPVVLFLSVRWNAWIAALASVLSALAFTFFQLSPVHSFTGLSSEGLSFLFVAAAAVYVARLSGRARAADERRHQEVLARARMVTAADEERRRVVRDLHDGAQERLVHAAITLQLARRALNDGDPKSGKLMDDALGYVERANSELRELAHGILPSVLRQGGLRAGVESIVSRISLPVIVDVADERFPEGIESTGYFVVSEALTNVSKHAHANHATVTARVQDGVLRVDITDDGVGGAQRTGGSGLTGLEDRVSALNGRLLVESHSGRGTRVRALLPLPQER